MNIGLAVLAAGQSARFKHGDKLLADLGGQTVLGRTIRTAAAARTFHHIGIVAPGQVARRDVFKDAGWRTTEAPDAARGQGRSIAAAARWALEHRLDGLILMLGDMPLVPVSHILNLAEKLSNYQAVFSSVNGVLLPPSAFRQPVFSNLIHLSGDVGAKALIGNFGKVGTSDLDAEFTQDVDTISDLQAIRRKLECQTSD